MSIRPIAQNRKAYHDYHVDETLEAGMALLGTEVKSLRAGRANLADGYVQIKDGEAFLLNVHISPYSHGNLQNHDPRRTRKLLLKKREIARLEGKTREKGITLIPLKLYFKGPNAKVEIGLCRGKRKYEKREAIKEREANREIRKAVKEINR